LYIIDELIAHECIVVVHTPGRSRVDIVLTGTKPETELANSDEIFAAFAKPKASFE